MSRSFALRNVERRSRTLITRCRLIIKKKWITIWLFGGFWVVQWCGWTSFIPAALFLRQAFMSSPGHYIKPVISSSQSLSNSSDMPRLQTPSDARACPLTWHIDTSMLQCPRHLPNHRSRETLVSSQWPLDMSIQNFERTRGCHFFGFLFACGTNQSFYLLGQGLSTCLHAEPKKFSVLFFKTMSLRLVRNGMRSKKKKKII